MYAPIFKDSAASHKAWLKRRRASLEGLRDRLQSPDGGFSYQPTLDKEPTEGFALSPYPERSFGKFASEITLNDLVDYVIKNEDMFKDPEHHFGAWHDPATGMAYLDISVVTTDPKKAEKLCRDHDQIAYFDLKAGKSITVNQSATSGGASKKGEHHGTGSKASIVPASGQGYDAGGHQESVRQADGPGANGAGDAGSPRQVGPSTPARILKANPYHDKSGRFTSKDKATAVKISGRLGSNPGGMYSLHGVPHYVKFPKEQGQIYAEEAADKIYELMGAATMKHHPQKVNGKTASVSAWQAVEPMGFNGWAKITDKQVSQAASMFVASALTNNWDVVGLAHDNIGTLPNGKLAILDTGGSFEFRAQGGPKDFGPDPSPELKAMLSKDKTSGRVFAPLMEKHRSKFVAAAKKLQGIPDEALTSALSGMGKSEGRASALLSRKQAILNFFGIKGD